MIYRVSTPVVYAELLKNGTLALVVRLLRKLKHDEVISITNYKEREIKLIIN